VGLLVTVFTLPALAMEYSFGGYWRTRGYTNRDFTGYDKDKINDPALKQAGKDARITWIDTRSRLFFTAAINENLKFVNGFEMNAIWGDGSTNNSDGMNPSLRKNYGGIGADGANFEIKNSYVDFNMGPMGGKVGVQGVTLGRGFLFDDDASAAVLSFNGDGFSFPIIWIKAFDIDKIKKRDVDFFAVSPSFSAGGLTVNPFGMFMFSDNASGYSETTKFDKLQGWYGGLNVDGKFGPAAVWLTGIYQGGSADLMSPVLNSNGTLNYDSVDFKAWLASAGFTLNFGVADIHGQGFYATGDDTPGDKDVEHFFVPTPYYTGQYYNWSEILGEGILDQKIPRLANGKLTPGTQIGGGNGNTAGLMAGNLGTTISPAKDLKISLDAWYVALVEDLDVASRIDGKITKENEIGIEANVKVTYTLVPGLNLDLIGAYLFAGDAMYQGEGAADPYEFGTRLSLSF
jgi:hypothetical protein